MKNETTLQADYLVIGSGAMGMAFCDVLLTETDASVLIVDWTNSIHTPGTEFNPSQACST